MWPFNLFVLNTHVYAIYACIHLRCHKIQERFLLHVLDFIIDHKIELATFAFAWSFMLEVLVSFFIRFDIDGYVTGFGNPDWTRTHEPALRTSPLVSALIEGGATCAGKTVLDDMAYR